MRQKELEVYEDTGRAPLPPAKPRRRRNEEPIKVKAYVQGPNGGMIPVEDLTPGQRHDLGTWLMKCLLEEQCGGRATFRAVTPEDPLRPGERLVPGCL